MHLKKCLVYLLLGLYTLMLELYMTVIIWIAPLETGGQIKHSLNSICDSEMSNMINYRLKALQMSHRLMLTNILPQGPLLIISYSLQILFYPPAACDPIFPFFPPPRFVIIHNLVPGHI